MGKAQSALCRRGEKNKEFKKVVEKRLEEVEDLLQSLQEIPNLQVVSRNPFSLPTTNQQSLDYRQWLDGSYQGLQRLNLEFEQVRTVGLSLVGHMESIRQKIARKISEIDELIGIIGKIESNDEEGHQELQQFVKKVSSRDLLVNKILPLRSQGTSRDIE